MRCKPVIIRFLERIRVTNIGCWEWLGRLSHDGYAKFEYQGKEWRVHRFIYEYYYGELDPRLTIDHLCCNKRCVNPKHLEQVTNEINISRFQKLRNYNRIKTRCKRGHPFNVENTRLVNNNTGKGRACKECDEIYRIEYNARRYQKLMVGLARFMCIPYLNNNTMEVNKCKLKKQV